MARRPPPKGEEQLDLFVAVFADKPIRDQRDMMERPFFSLAKKPRLKPIEYQVGDVWVRVTANADSGMATIWDADVLIWAATQLTEAHDRGIETSPILRFYPYELLKAMWFRAHFYRGIKRTDLSWYRAQTIVVSGASNALNSPFHKAFLAS